MVRQGLHRGEILQVASGKSYSFFQVKSSLQWKSVQHSAYTNRYYIFISFFQFILLFSSHTHVHI
jgi:hypothetical protein